MAVATRGRVSPSEDGTGLHVVTNAASGSGAAPDALDEIRAGLPGARITVVERGDELTGAMEQAASSARSLGVLGGDGTVNIAARAAIAAGVPLAVFPGGTLNHFARDLGLDEIAGTIDAVRAGHVVAIDVGEIAGHVFVNNASLGSYSELVDAREALEARIGKWPAMSVALARVLRRSQRHDVCIDGRHQQVWMVFIGNGAYQPAGFAPVDRTDLADGLLDVRIIDASRPWSRTRLVVALLLGQLARSGVYDQHCVPSLAISATDGLPTRLAADGETFDGPAEVAVSKRPIALRVHVPDPASRHQER